jgi:septum formation protein
MTKTCQSGPQAAPRLILASTSPYRRALLGRLGLAFEPCAPGVDEAELPGEPPAARAGRLALDKARACAAPGASVIGSDQVASLDGTILHKPGSPARAIEQLLACQGRTVDFHTAVAVVCDDRSFSHVDLTRVRFRSRPRSEIARYVELENALDCAGGFKCEGLGIALFEQIESLDPTALIGLPLIWLGGTLARLGHDPLRQKSP